MTLSITLERHGAPLSTAEERRVRHHLEALGRRLANRPDPVAVLSLSEQGRRHEIVASLRVQLGPLGPTLVSSQVGQTSDQATRLAVTAIERQLERRVAAQRRESSYGVPSRRRAGTYAPPAESDEVAEEASPPPSERA